MSKYLGAILGVVFALTVSGCGGSDSPTTTPTPPPTAQPPIDPNLTVPVQTAFANVVNNGLGDTFTISGWIDQSTANNPIPPTPITGSGQLTLGAAVGATLCNFAVRVATESITGSTIANGVSSPFATAGKIYYRNDNTTVATDTAGQLFLYTAYAYPATVRAGDIGSTGNGTQINANCTQTAFGANITGTYSVASDSATSLLVTFVADEKNPFSGSETQSSTVYRINTTGNVSLVSSTAVKSFLGSVYQTLIFTF